MIQKAVFSVLLGILMLSFAYAESSYVGLEVTPAQPDVSDGWYNSAEASFYLVKEGERKGASTSTLYCMDYTNTCEPKTAFTGTPIQLEHQKYLRYYTPNNPDVETTIHSFGPLNIESTPPVSSLVYSVSPNENGWISSGTTVQIIAEDEETAVRSTIYCIAEGSESDCEPTTEYTSPLEFAEGIYVLKYYSYNERKFIEEVKTETIRVDKTKPNLPSFTFLNVIEGSDLRHPELDSVAEVSTFMPTDPKGESGTASGADYCEMNFVSENWVTVPVPAQGEVLSEKIIFNEFPAVGEYTAKIRCYDKAGNVSDIFSVPITVIDRTPPVVSRLELDPEKPSLDSEGFWILVCTEDTISIADLTVTINAPITELKGVTQTTDNLICKKLFALMNDQWVHKIYTLTVMTSDSAGNEAEYIYDIPVADNFQTYYFLSATDLTQGDTLTITGGVTSRTGRAFPEGHMEFSEPSLGTYTGELDAEGKFSVQIPASAVGTFQISATYKTAIPMDPTILYIRINPAPEPEPQPAPVSVPTGGGGGGGGGSTNPRQSNLVRLSVSTIETGKDMTIDAFCRWTFGCLLEIEDHDSIDLTQSSGKQEFTVSFDKAGTKTIKLYHKGSRNRLVAEKTVRVTKAPESSDQNHNIEPGEQEQITDATSGSQEVATPVESTQTDTGKQETGTVDLNASSEPAENTPTGLFAAGTGAAELPVKILAFLVGVIAGFMFFALGKQAIEQRKK